MNCTIFKKVNCPSRNYFWYPLWYPLTVLMLKTLNCLNMFDPTQSTTKVSTVKSVYKQLIKFLLPLGWDALNLLVPIYTPGWKEAIILRVEWFTQEHNTMSPTKAQTQTAQSAVEHTKHEASSKTQGLSQAAPLRQSRNEI